MKKRKITYGVPSRRGKDTLFTRDEVNLIKQKTRTETAEEILEFVKGIRNKNKFKGGEYSMVADFIKNTYGVK